RPVEVPIESMIAAELAAAGSLSTRWFHGFDFGKTGQRGAEGTRSANAEPPAQVSARTTTAMAAARALTWSASAEACPFRTLEAGTRRPPPRCEPIEETRTRG